MGFRPTQSVMYVPLQVKIFNESILLIVQYKHLKSCSEIFILQILILRTRSCVTDLLLNLVGFFISTRLRWSGGNDLYHSCTSFEGASRGDQSLNIFTWFIGAGGLEWLLYHHNTQTHTHKHTRICIYTYTYIYEYIYVYIYIYADIYIYVHVYIYRHMCIHVYIQI